MLVAFAHQNALQSDEHGSLKATSTLLRGWCSSLFLVAFGGASRFCKALYGASKSKATSVKWRETAVFGCLLVAFLFSIEIRESHMRACTRPYEGEKSSDRTQKRLALGGHHGC